MTLPPDRLIIPSRFILAFVVLTLLCQCRSTRPNYQTVQVPENRLTTPPHNMARHEYPFDEQGQYRREWVRKRSSGGSPSFSSPSRSSYTAPRPSSPPPAPKPKTQARYHTIARGDTLFNISRRYGTTVARLKSVNGLTSDLIRIGQTLRIP